MFVTVVTNQSQENGTQKSEDQSLNQSDQKLHKVERKSREESASNDKAQGSSKFPSLLTTVDVSKETEAQGHGTNRD